MFQAAGSYITQAMPPGIQCTLFALLVIIIAMLALNVFDRWPVAARLTSNEVPGIIFGAISTLYALVLAFVVVAAWDDYEKLTDTIEEESDRLNSVMTHSSDLPDHLHQTINTALINYCYNVIGPEWKMQDDSSEYRSNTIHPLRMYLFKVVPSGNAEASNLNVIDQELAKVGDLRRARLSHNRSHIPAAVWFVLGIGSVGLILFSFFFQLPSRCLRRFCLSALAGCMATCLYLVYVLDHPFSSAAHVSNLPYVEVLNQLKNDN